MKNLKFGHFYIIASILFFGFFHFRGVRIQNEIKNHGKDIVVKYVKKKSYPKTTDFYFTYYVDDSLYTTSGSGIKYDILNSDAETQSINNLKNKSYYSAKFNPKYPNNIIVNPYKQITDTVEIEKFGFIMKEKN
ncbi:hypothetical protein ACSVH5_01210 [Flavobacterium sp. RSSA_27]|uniref:hypothetical protein n=1 Tax=Flavobacterium sp. RSSA_27 TaxID=3447667 RepID=UPI003F3F0A06